MERITDRAALAVFCLTVLAAAPVGAGLVAAFLCAVICAALSEVLRRSALDYALCGVWIVAQIAAPQFVFFYPQIAYTLCGHGAYIPLAVGLLAALARHPLPGLQSVMLTLAGTGLALLLRLRSGAVVRLRENLGRTRDDSAEHALLLEEKNRGIIQNQNTEIYAATLRERNRIAREIHDSVGHLLSRAILMVGALRAAPRQGAPGPMLADLEGTLSAAMTSIRHSVHDLRDDAINLREALQSLVRGFYFCRAELVYDADAELPSALKYSVLAIVSEALNNIIKHSGATRVSVLFREHPGMYQLVITDDGQGLPPAQILDGRGMGLENMRGRVRALGGSIRFKTDNGFRIFVAVPKEDGAA
ncbi:MAG: histidine kinase [Oscillospiraceae bacterium]|jgi:signal transduction histidine kinase|nr:histidine kinase [Oscillospiraceae bacterium]